MRATFTSIFQNGPDAGAGLQTAPAGGSQSEEVEDDAELAELDSEEDDAGAGLSDDDPSPEDAEPESPSEDAAGAPFFFLP